MPQRPGVRVQHVYTCPELLGVMYACATIPGSSGSFVRLSYPYPELLEVLYDIHTRTWNFWKFYTSFATIPGVRVQLVLYPTGTSRSFVCLCHNARSLWKFCNTSIPVPENSGSSVRPPYPYPESTNPTEHDLGFLYLSTLKVEDGHWVF